jgi:glucoamylase
MLFADQYLATGGNASYVTSQLYNSSDPSTGIRSLFMSLTAAVIKADLDYVAENWVSPGCDLWEEVYGFHFFTRLVLC